MSNTNTSTNNDQNRNQNSERGGQGQEDPSDGGRSDRRKGCGNKTIEKYAFEGEMKDGPISKLLITKPGHRSTQFKKTTYTLAVLCADKTFQGLNKVLQTGINLTGTNSLPIYPNATRWSNTHHVEIQTVVPTAAIDPATGVRPPITVVVQKKTSLTQISRSSYCRNTNQSPRSSLKSTPSSLPTRRL